MTRNELNTFQRMLEMKHEELTQSMGRRDGISVERTADAMDEVRLAADRELGTRTLERGSILLRNVRAALARMAEGTYGTCPECEDEISRKRLQAVPWAPLCITCQEQADRNDSQRFATPAKWMQKAA